MDMMFILAAFYFYCAAANAQINLPTIISSVQHEEVANGDPASFTCSIENLGTSSVLWTYQNQHLDLFRNSLALTKDDGYLVKNLTGQTTILDSILLIHKASSKNAGYYSCSISGTNVKQTHQLAIQTAGVIPTYPPPAPSNFTECCVKQGISEECRPACFPSQLPILFDYMNCATDLNILLECGSDGKNHAPCCLERDLPDVCTGFCLNDPPSDLTSEYQVCLDRAQDIIECYEEGALILPSRPRDVKAAAKSKTQILVKWNPPEDNIHTLVGYRVSYRKNLGPVQYETTHILTSTSYEVSGLEEDTLYTVFVTAIGLYGSSQHSFLVIVRTQAQVSSSGDSISILDCCLNRDVSSLCSKVLCSGTEDDSSQSSDLVFQCLSHIDTAMACYANEGNHTECCKRRDVPESCYDTCAGGMPSGIAQIQCYTKYRPLIVSCFEEGRGILPGAPNDVTVDEVKSTSAALEWNTPAIRPEKVVKYKVEYRPYDASQEPWAIDYTTETTYSLSGLNYNTRYIAQVTSIGEDGLSIASPSIIFRTYYSGGVITEITTIPPTASPGQTIQECCTAAGVSHQCHDLLCDYTVDFSSLNTVDLIACTEDIAKILACGADGRNHSSCCIRRDVPDDCLEFCTLDQESAKNFTLSLRHISCAGFVQGAVQCFLENKYILPGMVKNVRVETYDSNSLSLAWDLPSGSAPIESYIIDYKKKSDDRYTTMESTGKYNRHFILQNLDADTQYEVRVSAASNSGTSLPSPILVVRTLPGSKPEVHPLPNVNFTAPGNITECCITEGISASCMPLCQGNSSLDIYLCESEINKLLKCAADGKNHAPCCERSNVPTECQNYCKGLPGNMQITSAICLSLIEQINSCFKEGFALLPSQPTALRLTGVSMESISLEWEEPVSSPNNGVYKYMFFYRSEYDDTFTSYSHNTTSATQITIENLKPSTEYEVFVVTLNNYGSSMPTPILRVKTFNDGRPVITIDQNPAGYLAQGTSVTLTCMAVSEPQPSVYWVRPDNTKVYKQVINFSRVTSDQTGRYTCVADNLIGGVSAKITQIKVQDIPTATAVTKDVYVEPGLALSAELICKFTGYPDLHTLNWKFGQEVFTANSSSLRHVVKMDDEETAGVTKLSLIINGLTNIKYNDYGEYVCQGNNSYGPASDTVNLHAFKSVTPVTPPTVAPLVPNVTACCIGNGVSSPCLSACTFDIDLTVLTNLPDPLACSKDLDVFLKCSADGRNHSSCCVKADVPDICLPFCWGQIAELNTDHYICLSYVAAIIDCMEDGHYTVPSTPRNVKAYLTNDGYIAISWDSPDKNADKTTSYDVHIECEDSKCSMAEKTINVRAPETSYLLEAVHIMTKYIIYVEAINHHGRSLPSTHAEVTVTFLNPSNPTNLRAYVVSNTHIRLDWDKPSKHPGAVTHFVIYTRKLGDSKFNKSITDSPLPTYRIDNAQPLTQYEIYVTARSTFAESGKSNTIVIKTEEAAHSSYYSSGNKTGLGLGIFFVMLFFVIVAVIGAFWYIRMRKHNDAVKREGGVAFENPGYATNTEASVTVMSPNGQGMNYSQFTNSVDEQPYETIDGEGYNQPVHLPPLSKINGSSPDEKKQVDQLEHVYDNNTA